MNSKYRLKKDRHDESILAKLREAGIKDLSLSEVGRALSGVVSYEFCAIRVSQLVKEGLTIYDVYPKHVFVDGIPALALVNSEKCLTRLLCADGVTRAVSAHDYGYRKRDLVSV